VADIKSGRLNRGRDRWFYLDDPLRQMRTLLNYGIYVLRLFIPSDFDGIVKDEGPFAGLDGDLQHVAWEQVES
jgi:hypothetical protein